MRVIVVHLLLMGTVLGLPLQHRSQLGGCSDGLCLDAPILPRAPVEPILPAEAPKTVEPAPAAAPKSDPGTSNTGGSSTPASFIPGETSSTSSSNTPSSFIPGDTETTTTTTTTTTKPAAADDEPCP